MRISERCGATFPGKISDAGCRCRYPHNRLVLSKDSPLSLAAHEALTTATKGDFSGDTSASLNQSRELLELMLVSFLLLLFALMLLAQSLQARIRDLFSGHREPYLLRHSAHFAFLLRSANSECGRNSRQRNSLSSGRSYHQPQPPLIPERPDSFFISPLPFILSPDPWIVCASQIRPRLNVIIRTFRKDICVMGLFGIPGLSFSWKRALGISAAKGRLSRRLSIPLTRSGRQRKTGAIVGCLLMFPVALFAAIINRKR